MFKKGLVAVALTSILSGCVVTEVCLPMEQVDIETTNVPSKASDDLKVIVLPVDMEFQDVAKGKLQSVLRNDLEATVEGTGANLVDRKLANKLKGEIKLAEQSGRYNTSGVPIADLAIITEVTASNLKTSFSESYTYENDDGETKRVPAKCSYDVEVKAVAKVVALPAMTVVQRIELSGSEYRSSETNNSRCPVSNASYTSMASEAATKSVEHNFELQKLLAPSAPVTEMRYCKKGGNQVKIAMGSSKKIKPGADITFSSIHKSDEGEIETYTLGEGYVVENENDAVKPTFSWVAIDEELAMKIRKGDSGKLIPEECSALDLECHMDNLTK